MAPRETIKDVNDLLEMLDGWFRPSLPFWDAFYANRERPAPFFADKPDENLVAYLENGWIPKTGRAADLGCGPGRNALYLARAGFETEGFDLSEVAIRWAEERAAKAGGRIRFECRSALDLTAREGYELVYDSGCMHTLLPHRRIRYIRTIVEALVPGGHFGFTCFAPGYGDVGGPEFAMTDWDVYRERSMNGGLAFTEEKIRYLLEDSFECVELRPMLPQAPEADTFGVPFLWTSLWRKKRDA